VQLDKDEIVTKTVITIYWPKFYDRQHQHSSQGFAAPVSPMTVATIFVDNMISIASQTSGEEADFGAACGILRKSSSTVE